LGGSRAIPGEKGVSARLSKRESGIRAITVALGPDDSSDRDLVDSLVHIARQGETKMSMTTRNSIAGNEARAKRDRVDDVSDPSSPEFNPSDPEFDPTWEEENSQRADNLGTGGISGIPLTGRDGIVRARQATDSILKGKR